MKVLPLAGLAFAAAFGIQTLSAVTITFDTASDFDNNFYKKVGVAGNATLGWVSDGIGGGYLQKGGSPSNSGTIYNSPNTSGSGGTGGTELQSPLSQFDNFTMQADLNFSQLDTGQSIGFYVKLNDTGTAGYAGLLRLNNAPSGAGDPDFRIFNLGSGASGAFDGGLVSSPILNGAPTFGTALGVTADTWYTFRLQVEDVGAEVRFTAELFVQGGAQLGNTLTFTTTTGGITGLGQVGLRLNSLSSQTVKLDNLSIIPIPEPAVVGLVLLGLTVVLFRIPRTRKC